MSKLNPSSKSQRAIIEIRQAFPDISAKLKACDPEVRNYITALKKENLRLHRKIAYQQAQYVSLQSQIQILAEEEVERIVNEIKLIEEAEKEASERMKHVTP